MSSEVTGHPGPAGEQTLATEVVPTLWEVAAVIAKAPVWIQQFIQTATLADGKSEEFLSFNYSFLSLSNTSHHVLLMYTTNTMKRKTKRTKKLW